MTTTTTTLNTGASVPLIGFGTWQVDARAIEAAARTGYRAFDSATFYDTERDVARGLAAAGVDVRDVFLTTKVWRRDMGYEKTLQAFETSRNNFGVEAIDLYLIHWPQDDERLVLDTWRAMEELHQQGKARAIGVSNFQEADLDLLAAHSDVVPAVNQIELSPLRQRKRLVATNTDRGIATSAWSPLGQGGAVLHEPTLTAIAAEVGATVAQVILRWMVDKQIVALPRSTNPDRIAQNFSLEDVELSPDHLSRIDDIAD